MNSEEGQLVSFDAALSVSSMSNTRPNGDANSGGSPLKLFRPPRSEKDENSTETDSDSSPMLPA